MIKLKKTLLLANIIIASSLNSCLVMPDYVPSADSIIASEIHFDNDSIMLHIGGATTLTYHLDKPESNETFYWYTADPSLVSVSQSGTIQANNASGKTTISLTAENKERKKNLVCNIEVTVVSNEEFFKTNSKNEITGILDNKMNTLILPQTLNDTPVTTIAPDAFSDCYNLKTLIIPNGYTTLSDHCFDGLTTLINLQLPTTLTYFGVSYGYLATLSKVFFGSQDGNRNSEGTYFIGGSKTYMYKISTYTDPLRQETREYATIVAAWGNFSAIPMSLDDGTNFNVYIEEIGDGALYGLRTIKNLTLHEKIRIVRKKAFAFSSLQEITLPSSITEIESGAFSCALSLNGIKTKSVSGLNSAGTYFVFGNSVYQYDDGSKTKLTLLCGCKNSSLLDGDYEVTIGKFAFDCVNYPNTDIRLPNSVVAINEAAFRNNKNVKSIYIPSSVKTIKDYINYDKLIRGIDSLGGKEEVPSNATGPFYGCINLEIRVPFQINTPIPSGYGSCWANGAGKGVHYNYNPS